jgi:hypothetical protein
VQLRSARKCRRLPTILSGQKPFNVKADREVTSRFILPGGSVGHHVGGAHRPIHYGAVQWQSAWLSGEIRSVGGGIREWWQPGWREWSQYRLGVDRNAADNRPAMQIGEQQSTASDWREISKQGGITCRC